MTITLNTCKTQVVWRSPDAGDKTTSIPGSVVGNKGYALNIASTLADGSTYIVTPTSGTIGGQPSFSFTEPDGERCNLSLISDADNADWVVKCLCCLPITVPIPPASFFIDSSAKGAIQVIGDSTLTSQVNLSTFNTDDVVVILIGASTDSVVGGAASPTVLSINCAGLTFIRRGNPHQMTATTNGGPQPAFTDTEVWWAHAPTILTNEVITVTFNGPCGTSAFVALAIHGPSTIDPWDVNVTLPKISSNPSGAASVVSISGVSTDSNESRLMAFGSSFTGGTTFFAFGINGWVWPFAESGNFQPFTGRGMDLGIYYLNVSSPQTLITAYTSGSTTSAWLGVADALV